MTQALRHYASLTPTGRGAFYLALLARYVYPRKEWKGKFVISGGFTLSLDLGTYPDFCMAFGIYELDTYRLFSRFLKPGSWFVDCGANIGYFTLLAASLVGMAGKVDAYEPDPENRRRLEAHLQWNGPLQQVRTHALAVGDRDREADLYHPLSGVANHGEATLCPDLFEKSEKYRVRVIRLDDHLKGIPDLVKMDIEGGELEAVQGMKKILQVDRPPRLILEHNAFAARKTGWRSSDLLRVLLKYQPRYRFFWIGGRRLKPIYDPDRLDNLSRQGNILVQAAVGA